MAQSAITLTPPNPTPPTNFSFFCQTPPNSPSQLAVDDGTAGTLTVFAAKVASSDNTNFPSVDHEAKGTETVVVTNYPPAYTGATPQVPLVTFSDLGNYTTNPNRDHASSLSPATNPTLTTLTPATAASGTGTQGLTVTGTGFVPGCRIWVNNQERPTTFISATSLSTTFNKSTGPGVWRVDVKLGGVAVPTGQNFTWT